MIMNLIIISISILFLFTMHYTMKKWTLFRIMKEANTLTKSNSDIWKLAKENKK